MGGSHKTTKKKKKKKKARKNVRKLETELEETGINLVDKGRRTREKKKRRRQSNILSI